MIVAKSITLMKMEANPYNSGLNDVDLEKVMNFCEKIGFLGQTKRDSAGICFKKLIFDLKFS